MSKMNSDNNFQGRFSGYFLGLYSRNKGLFIFSAAIFFAGLFSGVLIGYFSTGFTGYFLAFIVKGLGQEAIVNTFSLFLHNFQSALVAYVGGVIGVIPAGEMAINGFIYGAFLGYFMHGGVVTNYFVSNPVDFIIYTLPHGIFEIPGFIIAATAGFRIATLVIGILSNMNMGLPINEHYWKFEDSIGLFAVAVTLLIIAAIIEFNFSIHIGDSITGLNLHSLLNY